MIRLAFCRAYGIVTIINIVQSQNYDFLIYIPSTQNYLGFSLPHHAFADECGEIDWTDIIKQLVFEIRYSK